MSDHLYLLSTQQVSPLHLEEQLLVLIDSIQAINPSSDI